MRLSEIRVMLADGSHKAARHKSSLCLRRLHFVAMADIHTFLALYKGVGPSVQVYHRVSSMVTEVWQTLLSKNGSERVLTGLTYPPTYVRSHIRTYLPTYLLTYIPT